MNNRFTLILGDSCEKLKELPDESIDCCITSPPYYGLRDYGTGTWVGGDPNCTHYRTSKINENNQTGHRRMFDKGEAVGDAIYKSVCPLCGAVRVDKQIGLEETPEEYIQKLVYVFREVKRVLKDSGTLWVNIGDSYNAGPAGSIHGAVQKTNIGSFSTTYTKKIVDSCKPKDLIGIPWMFAFAMRDDGWYLRQDIIWKKPNPMPESVKDRFTKSHEYIFLFSKCSKYYFDIDATMEVSKTYKDKLKYETLFGESTEYKKEYKLRHKRDVWDICVTSGLTEHHAAYPTEIVENCILSGCKPNGVVLDPFNGSGTTGIVANELERDYIGIELSKKYFDLTKERFDSIGCNNEFVGIVDDK